MIVYRYKNEKYYSRAGLQTAFPETSLPADLTAEALAEIGIEMKEIAPTPPTLEELKRMKVNTIVNARNADISSGTLWNGHPIHTDADAQRLVLALAGYPSLGETPFPTWTCSDGHVVQLDQSSAQSLILTVQSYVSGLYDKSAGLITNILSAQTAEEVEAVVWDDD